MPRTAPEGMRVPVLCGIDQWAKEGFGALRGKSVGAIVNPTSLDAGFRHLADLLHEAPGVRLSALFGPEHGIRGDAEYMVPVGEEAADASTGVPVHSLYGKTFESLTPRPDWLRGLDVVLFDIQDVGARYYTYVNTMALAMRACARARVAFVVLDRPNPLNGRAVEGNLVEEGCRSFVGLFPIPNRHGLTAGEIARFVNAEEDLGCELKVVPCVGWRRSQCWHETGLPFVPPSPNMPTPDTAMVYPGMCLLEGTNISEGRGTCRPFEQFGAPWLDSRSLIALLARERLPGVVFRATTFTPSFDKFAGQRCRGAMLHVSDRESFRPVRTGLAVVKACRDAGGDKFEWRREAYEFVDDRLAFDLLCGTQDIRLVLQEGGSLDRATRTFAEAERLFEVGRAKYMLYE